MLRKSRKNKKILWMNSKGKYSYDMQNCIGPKKTLMILTDFVNNYLNKKYIT